MADVPVEHAVAMKDFRAWLDRPARSPRDVTQRVREMGGAGIYTVSKLLRHGNVATSQRYAHLSDEHLQYAVERLASDTGGGAAPEIPTRNIPQRIQ